MVPRHLVGSWWQRSFASRAAIQSGSYSYSRKSMIPGVPCVQTQQQHPLLTCVKVATISSMSSPFSCSLPQISNTERSPLCRNFSSPKNSSRANKRSSQKQQQAPPPPPPPPRYAAVDHGYAYEAAMAGNHGHQLALAELEGRGKDDPPFDPFELEELMLQEAQEDEDEENEAVDEDDGSVVNDEPDEDNEDDDNDTDRPDFSKYTRDGSVRRPKSQLATLRAGAPGGGMFAILELAGTQFKVTTDDLLVVNRLQPIHHYKVGSVHSLENICMVSCSHYTLVGMPHVTGATVKVMVEEITQDAKLIVFKKRRRKNYRRKQGFRRDVTFLRILEITPPAAFQNRSFVPRVEPAAVGPSPQHVLQMEAMGKEAVAKVLL